MKFLIFDAGPLISLTLSGLLSLLEKIKKKNIEFIITPQVKKEVIDRAMTIKKYKLEAIKLSDLIEKRVLRESGDFIDNQKLSEEITRCVNSSKRILKANKKGINLVQAGEASCISFAKLINQESLIVIDERTTRLISESIDNLKHLMEKKLHMTLQLNKADLSYFQSLKYIRSSELVYLAFKNGLVDLKKDVETLDALLYSLKFNGAAISSREIEDLKNLKWA